MSNINCLLNSNQHVPSESISDLAKPELFEKIINFHRSIPNYQMTPLVRLNALSAKLKIDSILVKDESQRFELNAFKMLGCCYAMAIYIADYLGLSNTQLSYTEIIKRKKDYEQLVFVTATDGNHGRAVAWSALQFGCRSHIYMPQGASLARLDAIKKYTKDASITEFNYDETVIFASRQAELNQWILMQDTAWHGYRKIPKNIMRGYFSLIAEFELQAGDDWPSHVFLQAGVGSMAASVAAYFVAHKNKTPSIILVEPTGAPCFYQSMSINDGQPHRTQEQLITIMAGLACGEPSISAWEILSAICSAFITCDDAFSIKGMRRYASPFNNDKKIISGESAAVTLGLLESILSNPTHVTIKSNLKLNKCSKVLLLSTEGNTDPDFYFQVVDNQIFTDNH